MAAVMGSAAQPCDASRMIEGACLCGSVRYEVEGPLQSLMHCHCSMCRKHHGAPFATFSTVPRQAFRWLGGHDALLEYRSSEARTRRVCSTCGSVAPAPLGDGVLLPAANLLDALSGSTGLHMFVRSRPSWHIIADGLPEYEGAPPDWPVREEAPPARAALESGIHGSCLCGEVTFSVSGAPARWLQCHCSRCRRGRSAAHASNTFYPTSQFEWRTGRGLVQKYKLPEAERFAVAFCRRCGGVAPVERDNVPFVVVPAALFDTELSVRPQAHIHVASKAPWYTLADGLPQFAELPPLS